MSKTSIIDIARIAGVSSATVSRTLRSPNVVTRSTREKVMQAVEATGYRPNRFAASLRTQKSNNILVIMPDITYPVNANIIRAIEAEATQHGYSILLGDLQNIENKKHYYADIIQSNQADGIILFTSSLPFSDELINDVKQLPPIVNSCEEIDLDVHKVLINNKAAAFKAVQHFIDNGHKKIAAITGPMSTISSQQRLEGYKEALRCANLKPEDKFIKYGDYGAESGLVHMKCLLSNPDKPTAVFCFSDEIAIGAMHAIKELKMKVPKDISLMGFDDIKYAKFMSPSLSTVKQPLERIGIECVQMLVDLINNKQIIDRTLRLPFELIIRDSTTSINE